MDPFSKQLIAKYISASLSKLTTNSNLKLKKYNDYFSSVDNFTVVNVDDGPSHNSSRVSPYSNLKLLVTP